MMSPSSMFIFCTTLVCISSHQNHEGHVEITEKYENNALQDNGVTQDREHIKTDFEGKLELRENMTAEELQFYFFEVHDSDKDGCLDGLEIYHALEHHSDYSALVNTISEADIVGKTVAQIKEMERQNTNLITDALSKLTDRTLKDGDYNCDGYISYAEYKQKNIQDAKMHAQETTLK